MPPARSPGAAAGRCALLAGRPARPTLGCVLLALLAWTRGVWVRRVLLLVLPLLAARWIWTTSQFVQVRQFMDQPWHRLAAILLGVALFTALAALPLLSERARARYARRESSAGAQLAALGLTTGILAAAWALAPGLFVLERFAPGWGLAQVFLPGLWAAWVAGRLSDRHTAVAARLWTWRLFSLVFFGQLLLGLTLDGRFLLSGNLHLPVPGVILAAPLYRGGGYFMLILFGVAVLLAGAAWCSQLCYFGVWDAGTAARGRVRPVPAWLPRLRLVVLALTLLAPVLLRLAGAPVGVALACGLLLGLLLPCCAGLFSRKLGFGTYCLGVCPLGLVASGLGRLSPWRVQPLRSLRAGLPLWGHDAGPPGSGDARFRMHPLPGLSGGLPPERAFSRLVRHKKTRPGGGKRLHRPAGLAACGVSGSGAGIEQCSYA